MFTNETEVNEIYFNTKYVSGKALDVITDFTNNTYIIKGSTGIGGTTALLNYTEGHCLIISPNIGMIKSKESGRGKYDSQKQLFIYGDGKDNWKKADDILNIYNNVIINTTPDQIIKLRNENKKLYESIIQIPVFIDEIHAYTMDSDYRIVLGQFLELVYNEWTASYKLSTATPNHELLDIPIDKDISIFRLIRENESIKKLQISNELKDAKQFIQQEHLKGRLVICFTNNPNYHKSFTELQVKNLVGQTLDIKLKPYDRGLTLEEDLYEDTDIIFLSSSYFAGYDIQEDCSICIISEQANEAYKININSVAQAYGRCRAEVHEALFVNATSKYTKTKNGLVHNSTISINQVNNIISRYPNDLNYYESLLEGVTNYWEVCNYEQITQQLYINRAILLKPILEKIYDYQLYNETALYKSLEGYGFEVSSYMNEGKTLKIKEKRVDFKTRLKNLLKLDENELYNKYANIKYELKFKNEGKYNAKLALEYLTAYLMKVTNATTLINKLDNKRVRPNEFYRSMDMFLRANTNTEFLYHQLTNAQTNSSVLMYGNDQAKDALRTQEQKTNDWQMLYACHRVTNNILSPEIEREIKLYELFYDKRFYINYNVDKNRVRNVKRAILKSCKQLSIKLDESELEWLDEVVKASYKTLDNGEELVININRKTIKNKMTYALVYLLTDGHIYKFKDIKNREYNPLTQLPSKMRSIIPIKYVSVDLTSANPQIVDSILYVRNGLNVYQSLMDKRNITRDKAKKLYNSTLNNHRLTRSKAKAIYLDAGYSIGKANELAEMTANVEKGVFYEVMTKNEKQLIKNYRDILPVRSYRFHDALIVKYEDVVKYNVVFPTKVKDYAYHIEFFNDGGLYDGPTTDIENKGDMVENRFYLNAI